MGAAGGSGPDSQITGAGVYGARDHGALGGTRQYKRRGDGCGAQRGGPVVCHARGRAAHLQERSRGEQASPTDSVIPQVRLVIHRDASLKTHDPGGGVHHRRLEQRVARRGEPEPLAVPRRRAPARRHTRDVRRARRRRDDVGVGALEGKRADAALGGALRRAGGRSEMLPGERHGVDGAGGGLAREAGEVRVDGLQVHDAARAEGASPHHRVKQPHRTGGGLGVPHARFHRRHGEGGEARRRVGLHQHGVRGAHLDGISQRRPRAVHLEPVHRTRVHARRAQGAADGALLGGAVGRGEGARPPVLVHRRPHERPGVHDDARVALAAALQRTQLQHHARLPAHVAVGAGVQSLAPAVLRKHPSLAEHLARHRAQGDVNAARRDTIGLAADDARDGDVRSHQRR